METKERRYFGISSTVIALGVVSLLTDISSEAVYPLIPLFLTNILHASPVYVGLIEGVAESTASILRIFSGWFSDVLGQRKWIAAAGYGLSSLSKPVLAIVTTWQGVLGVRFADRLGKGIRSAPRDALIADVTPPEKRGLAFGMHRAMDTMGAVTGPLIAFFFLKAMDAQHQAAGDDYRRLFMYAAVPGVLGVLILIFFVKEKARKPIKESLPSLSLSQFDPRFKKFLWVAVLFSIGNSSDAFLILRAQNLGVSVRNILLLYVTFNSMEALLAAWMGHTSDKQGRRNVIVAGYLVFAVVYGGFGLANQAWMVWGLFALYGLYKALTSGVQKAFACDLVCAESRGTGMGAYHMLTGLALLPASVIAGYLWKTVGPAAPFIYGSVTAVVAALFLLAFFPKPTATCTDM